jgi:cyclophilin family peptidyl-prolyl cis-trans isomerase
VRVVAIVSIVALLILGGFWLSQRGEAESVQPDAPAPEAATVEPIDTPGGTTEVARLADEPAASYERADAVLEPDRDYLALIETNRGEILIDLFESRAPDTVNNFVFLALQGYYDGIVFHRVLEDFMAQTGDPTGTGRGGPGYQFDDEFAEGLGHDQPGMLSMANAGPGTNGSQFFITFAATPWLDGRHAIFGQVIDGLEVLPELTRIDPSSPSVVAVLDDPVSEIVEQGISLEGPTDITLGEKLTGGLGAAPVEGQTFTIDGYQGVVGRIGGDIAVGFFPEPDVMERVTILTRDE